MWNTVGILPLTVAKQQSRSPNFAAVLRTIVPMRHFMHNPNSANARQWLRWQWYERTALHKPIFRQGRLRLIERSDAQ